MYIHSGGTEWENAEKRVGTVNTVCGVKYRKCLEKQGEKRRDLERCGWNAGGICQINRKFTHGCIVYSQMFGIMTMNLYGHFRERIYMHIFAKL